MGIYHVRVYGRLGAELEIAHDGSSITCVSGSKKYFEIPRDRLVWADQTSRDTILLNFMDAEDGRLVQVSVTSDSCMSVMAEIQRRGDSGPAHVQ